MSADKMQPDIHTAAQWLDVKDAEIAALKTQIEAFKTEREYIWGFNDGFDEATAQLKAENKKLREALERRGEIIFGREGD